MSRLTSEDYKVVCMHTANMRKARVAKNAKQERAFCDAVEALEIDVSKFKGGYDGADATARKMEAPINAHARVEEMGFKHFTPDMIRYRLRKMCSSRC
jgi:hypothetical protein